MNTSTSWEQLRKEVANQHSIIRTNPSSYIPLLENYMKCFKGNILYKSGENVGIQTYEGPSAYLECIEFLKNQKPVGELIYDEELSRAAQDHADDIGPEGLCDHEGTDGSTIDNRVERYLEWDVTVSENMDFGADTAEDIIISLIVDDGIDDRGHRMNIFKPEIKFIGVGIAEHAEYQVCTVIDYVGEIRQYYKDSSEKIDSQQKKYVKDQHDDNSEKSKRLKEVIENRDKRISKENHLAEDFEKNSNIKSGKITSNYSAFPDDPDAPEGAIACKIKIITKTYGKIIEKKTIKTYTLEDGSQEVVEILESESI